jgi:glycosyltransferase involved in cell wall biosynthesis
LEPYAAPDRPRLSICIPTYNRAELLRHALTSIKEAAAQCPLAFEVVINDNASTDATGSVAKAFAAEGLDIRYFRNSENVGANPNLVIAASHARGDYVWLFGDDDVFKPDSLSLVAAALDDDPDALVLDFEVRDRDCNRTLLPSYFGLSGTKWFTDRNTLLAQVNGKLGLLSCMVAKRSVWNTVTPAEHERFVPTGLNHVYAFYAMLPLQPRVGLVHGPVFAQRADNSGGFDWRAYFIVGFATVYESLGRLQYSQRSINAAKSANCLAVIARYVTTHRLAGEQMGAAWPRLLRYYRWIPAFWLVVVPLMLVPRPVLSAQRSVRMILSGRTTRHENEVV